MTYNILITINFSYWRRQKRMLIENVCFVESLRKFDAYCIWDLEVGWLFGDLTYILPCSVSRNDSRGQCWAIVLMQQQAQT